MRLDALVNENANPHFSPRSLNWLLVKMAALVSGFHGNRFSIENRIERNLTGLYLTVLTELKVNFNNLCASIQALGETDENPVDQD